MAPESAEWVFIPALTRTTNQCVDERFTLAPVWACSEIACRHIRLQNNATLPQQNIQSINIQYVEVDLALTYLLPCTPIYHHQTRANSRAMRMLNWSVIDHNGGSFVTPWCSWLVINLIRLLPTLTACYLLPIGEYPIFIQHFVLICVCSIIQLFYLWHMQTCGLGSWTVFCCRERQMQNNAPASFFIWLLFIYIFIMYMYEFSYSECHVWKK